MSGGVSRPMRSPSPAAPTCSIAGRLQHHRQRRGRHRLRHVAIRRLGQCKLRRFADRCVGAIQGFGSFEKTGSSTWTLTGSNAAALPWSVNAGTLTVNGMASSTFTVNAGGALAGTGTVGDVTVAAGARLAPGNALNPTGMLGIAGNLAFQAGALYVVQVTPSSAASATVSGSRR